MTSQQSFTLFEVSARLTLWLTQENS